MQHKNCLSEACDIDDAKCTALIADANFANARTDARHWFPTVWLKTTLHAFELKAGFPACLLRKCTQAFQCVSEKLNLFHLYIKIDIERQRQSLRQYPSQPLHHRL